MMMIPGDAKQAGNEPLYNIGVVSRMTGLSMATLRAWERRYDFPAAERTSGGHRLYSEKDVIRLRWVKSRIEEGMQTAQAIHALTRQEQTGLLRLVDIVPITEGKEISLPSAHLIVYQERFYDALIRKDLSLADDLLGEILAISVPEKIILEIISPTLAQVGEAWEHGKIDISTEHFVTNYLRQRLLMWMLTGPTPRPTRQILLACAPNEWHEGSLLILGALLRRRRWPVAYLGQALPLLDLASFVNDIHPSLVILVAMTEETASELVHWVDYMPDIVRTGKPIIGYGGRIFSIQPEWRNRMQGLYLGSTFEEGLSTIEKVI
jgi:DNA-binding transcriptional MerR regulator